MRLILIIIFLNFNIFSNKNLDLSPYSLPFSPLIIDSGILTAETMKSFILSVNKNIDTKYLDEVVNHYIKEAKIEDINHDIAFAQMILETSFLRFTGVVNIKQNNFAGIGAVDNFTPGNVFNDVQIGVRAHIQHLKTYASIENLRNPTVTPRRHLVKEPGKSKTFYDLTGKWAMDLDYGKKIENIIYRLFNSLQAKL